MPTQERIYRDPIMDWAPNSGARSVNLLARYAEPPRLVPPSAPAQPTAGQQGDPQRMPLADFLSGRTMRADGWGNPMPVDGEVVGSDASALASLLSGIGMSPNWQESPWDESIGTYTNTVDPDLMQRITDAGYTFSARRTPRGGSFFDMYGPDGALVNSVRSGDDENFVNSGGLALAAIAAMTGAGLAGVGAGGGGVAAGEGAFLGEGVASGVGAWDAAAGLGAAGGGAGGVGAAGGSLGSLGPGAGSGVINTGIGDAIGAASAQGAGSGALGAGGLSSAEAAALYGSAGYGPGMTGLQTTIYDGAINAGLGGGVANAASNVTGGIQGAANALGGSSSGNSLLGSLGGNGNLLNLGGNLLSGYMQSRAADRASDAQVAAAQEANALQRYMYDTTRSDFAPWREAGVWGLGQQRNLLEDPSAITRDPSYSFGLNEGRKAFEGSAASRGGLFSGATLKALERYGQDYGGTKLNEAYNRYAGLSGTGQQATRDVAGAGQNYANNASQNMLAAGNARGAGYVGQNNAWAGAISNMLNNYQQQQLLNRLFPGG